MMKCSDSHLVNVNKSKDFAILNLRYNLHTPDEFYTVKKGQCSLLDTQRSKPVFQLKVISRDVCVCTHTRKS